ncbi:hypothetical protein Bca101_064721 [Brassica carinata]
MAKSSILLLYLSVFFFIITKLALAQTCSNYKFSSNTLFESCNDLPVLDSFLHYTYDSSSSSLQIAYRHTNLTSKKWVAWAVNPTSTGMVGAQAIVAYPQSDGSLRAYTSAITSYQTSLREAGLSFNVSELSATYQNNEMIIFATLTLPLANGGNINTVWQDGSLSGNNLLSHPTSGNNIRSVFTMNLLSGASGGAAGGDSKLKKRNVSWATGLKLGWESAGIQFSTHRAIGISFFCFATVQVFAMFLDSNKSTSTESTGPPHHWLYRDHPRSAFKWYVVIKRRKAEQSAETSQLGHGGESHEALTLAALLHLHDVYM